MPIAPIPQPSPNPEQQFQGYTLKLQAANYMRRLPLREGVTVSSPQGVHVPAIESNSTVPNPAAKAEQNYSLSEFHAYCAEGQDITTEEGCRAAASKLGLEFEHSWEGPADHHLCLFAQDAMGPGMSYERSATCRRQSERCRRSLRSSRNTRKTRWGGGGERGSA